jgi:hypothetical protein
MLAGALAMLVPFVARAEGAAAEREAQARFVEGIGRVKAGNFEGARMSFAQAYAVLHKPTILWNLALAEEKTGHVLEALGHFKDFARGLQTGEDLANADKHINALMEQTARLDVTAPAGAQITVDGTLAGSAPLDDAVDVMPGRHHVEARTQLGAKETDVEISAGQLVRVNLAPMTEAAGPSPGPPATGLTTGNEGRVPRRSMALAPPAGGAPDLEGARNGPSPPQIISVALVGTGAAVSVGLGAYFALQSQNDQSTARGLLSRLGNSHCAAPTTANSTDCAQWSDVVRSQGREATTATALYIAGGVLALGAVATWLLWPKEPVLVPTVGPAGAGLGATGRF